MLSEIDKAVIKGLILARMDEIEDVLNNKLQQILSINEEQMEQLEYARKIFFAG